jgi:hypothetical protein
MNRRKRWLISFLLAVLFLALLTIAGFMIPGNQSAAILVADEVELRLPMPPAFWYLLALGVVTGGAASLVAVLSGLRRAGSRAREYWLEHEPDAWKTDADR